MIVSDHVISELQQLSESLNGINKIIETRLKIRNELTDKLTELENKRKVMENDNIVPFTLLFLMIGNLSGNYEIVEGKDSIGR